MGTRRRNYVDATSLRRIDVVTSHRRRYDVMCLLGIWPPPPLAPPPAPPKILKPAPPNILNLPTPMLMMPNVHQPIMMTHTYLNFIIFHLLLTYLWLQTDISDIDFLLVAPDGHFRSPQG